MTRMKTLACSACLILAGVAPVAADNTTPTLRMRNKPQAPRAPWSVMRWAKRVAQAAPDPAPAPVSAGDPAAPAAPVAGDQAPAAPATEPAPAAPAPAPAAAAELPQALSDEELARLAEEGAKTEVISVTGSLIDRREVDSPSPVSVVDHERIESAGLTNLGEILQKIPAQGNALNAQNNNGGNGSTRIDLRSLGPNRTLTLLNGRRVVNSGTGADISVDIGSIPTAMIERVEVLKDGASAIYGSDAISGVVNVITRSNINGTEANVYTATSGERDGTNYDLSFVTGHSSSRGNITFSGGYQQQKPVLAGDRDFSKQVYAYDFTCTPAREAAGECSQFKLSGSPASPSGRINALPGSGHNLNIPGCHPTEDNPYCTADGNGFRSFIPSTATTLGDNYNFQPLNYLFTPSTRLNLFSNGHYDITKNTHAFFEGQFNSRKSTQQLAEEPVNLGLFGLTISKDNMYNPFGADIVDYQRRLTEFGPRTSDQDINTVRMVVGLNGTLDESLPVVKNWKWEVSYDYGRTDATNSSRGDLILSHLANALGPSFTDSSGAQCGRPGNPIAGCVPLSILTPGTVTQPMIDYLTFTGTQSGLNEEHVATGTASGRLLDLPNHGDLSLAIGGDYRFEKGAFQPDPLTATGDTTGNSVQPTRGSYHALEGFGEMSLVPYAEGEVVKWTELNAAARAYDYNTFGSGVTGKLSALVRFDGGVALRGTYGTSFRAPNVAELFSGQADSFQLLDDPCDVKPASAKMVTPLSPMVGRVCHDQGVPDNSTFGSPQQRVKIGGNPKLDPETAKVGTAGLVYEPLHGLDVTLDYWNIQIDHAITGLPPTAILASCYQGGVDSYCKQITRDPVTHTITRILDLNQNVGSFSTSGLDFSAAYQYRNAAGRFRHAIEGTYLFKNNVDTGTIDPMTGKESIIHGKNFYDLGVNPDLKFNVFTSWNHPSGVGAGFNVQFVDSFQECQADNCNDPSKGRREVSKYARGDLYVNYALKSSQGTTGVMAGVNNVTNAAPPIVYEGATLNADPSAYDFMGRQFYIRLSQQF